MRWSVVALLLATTGGVGAASTLERLAVRVSPVPGVQLDVSTPVEPEVHTLPAADGLPARIYVDLPGTVLGNVSASTPADAVHLLRVRAGQFTPLTTRIVLDLAAPTAYVVRRTDTHITIELGEARKEPVPTVDAAPHAPIARSAPTPAPIARPSTDTAHRPLVVIDAGHGGRDPGATGLDGVLEKTVTLELAQRVALRLPDRLPVEVQLTRRDDAFLPIDTRIALAPEAALFISLHANASLDPRMRGIEVFFGGGGPTAAASGAESPVRLGLAVVEALEQRLGEVRTLVRPGDYGVLARNAVPSVLIEVGYLTNVDDAARLRNDAYRDRITDAVIDAVDAFLHDRIAS
jgi:N-acetylmuramoyl-L-alanine amidase